MKQLNLFAGLGVAVLEFPTSTGPADYVLFLDGTPVGIIEAKKDIDWLWDCYAIKRPGKVRGKSTCISWRI